MDFITGYYQSPIGTIQIKYSGDKITSLIFSGKGKAESMQDLFFQNSFIQLDEYFTGKRKVFDLKLDLKGTDFQKQVWKILSSIPFGQTLSYSDVAKKMGDPKKARAVANANAKNPVSIMVPCHRVIGSNGDLTGYAGGLWRKKWLLEHEHKFKQLALF